MDGLREEYFAFLGQHLPTLCLHDEFIYFPRVSAAWDHWPRAARLEAAFLESTATRAATWLSRLETWSPLIQDPELHADAALLRQSLASVRRELRPGGPWERDPFFYLKTATLAWAPVLAQASRLNWAPQENLAELLANVAQVLDWGRRQVHTCSRPAHLLSPGAFADARRFFGEVVRDFLESRGSTAATFRPLLQELSRNLGRFQEAVAGLPVRPGVRGEAELEEILTASWGCQEGLEAAAVQLQEEIRECRQALTRLAGRAFPGRTWSAALEAMDLPGSPVDLLELYRREVARLWRFWEESPLLPRLKGRVVVAETPVYLRTLRSSASYAAPWGPPEDTPGFFYVSPELEDRRHHLLHYRHLSAHETVPGHHLLDATRLSLTSPLRRQYESPLYYEGWACYAETLLSDAGYLRHPRELLVGWQRRLWRALRGLADLKMQQGRWNLEDGGAALGEAGYPEATARLQVLQLALNPGYQLCYTLGLREILRLKARYAGTLGPARFHEVLLSGGQLPFGLLEQRLEAARGGSEGRPS